jgi:CheY-like chemotaxis protein
MSVRPARPIEVLLVDDDEDDVLMMREALRTAKSSTRLEVLGDGSEVIPYLRGEGDHARANRLDLILLDLNLPGRAGNQVLADIKGDPDLRRIPVVILTVSGAEEDVLRSYDLHANAYVTKPVDLNSFLEAIRKIDEFFITVVRLPPA